MVTVASSKEYVPCGRVTHLRGTTEDGKEEKANIFAIYSSLL